MGKVITQEKKGPTDQTRAEGHGAACHIHTTWQVRGARIIMWSWQYTQGPLLLRRLQWFQLASISGTACGKTVHSLPMVPRFARHFLINSETWVWTQISKPERDWAQVSLNITVCLSSRSAPAASTLHGLRGPAPHATRNSHVNVSKHKLDCESYVFRKKHVGHPFLESLCISINKQINKWGYVDYQSCFLALKCRKEENTQSQCCSQILTGDMPAGFPSFPFLSS